MSSADRPLPRSHDPVHDVSGRPREPAEPGRLAALVRRVADADRPALAELYDTLSARVLADLRTALPRPADAEAIMYATFAEAWSLARFHTDPDTDVHGWIAGIATRRARERPPAARHPAGPDVSTPGRQLWWADVEATHDQRATLALAQLIGRPVDRPAG